MSKTLLPISSVSATGTPAPLDGPTPPSVELNSVLPSTSSPSSPSVSELASALFKFPSSSVSSSPSEFSALESVVDSFGVDSSESFGVESSEPFWSPTPAPSVFSSLLPVSAEKL